MTRIRFVFYADTHLGFDHPFAPRVERRRRGDDFFRMNRMVLDYALAEKADFIVHGGDLFYRSKVPRELVVNVFQPFFDVADKGLPIYIVPGNHERSEIPHSLLALHRGVHIYETPGSFTFRKGDFSINLFGFPYVRHNVRETFPEVLKKTGFSAEMRDLSFLVMHHAVEGARVGPAEFMFRNADDVIRHADIPGGLNAVLSGHIHRHQVLTRDLAGKPVKVPVLYPGSVERTAWAEMGEIKGFLVIDCEKDETLAKWDWRFVELPARPMLSLDYKSGDNTEAGDGERLRQRIAALPTDAVVRVRIVGSVPPKWLSANWLRKNAPETMNIELSVKI